MCRLSSFVSTGEIYKFNALHMHKRKISDPLKGLDIRPFRCAIREEGEKNACISVLFEYYCIIALFISATYNRGNKIAD